VVGGGQLMLLSRMGRYVTRRERPVPQAPPRRRADGGGDDVGRVRTGGGPDGIDGSWELPRGSSRWPFPAGSALLPWPTGPRTGWAREVTAATVRRPVWCRSLRPLP
jgi:hypothetical protein